MKIQISFDIHHGFEVDFRGRSEDFNDPNDDSDTGTDYIEVYTVEDFIDMCEGANYDTLVVLNKDLNLDDIIQLHDWEAFAGGSVEEELHRLYDEYTSKEG